MNPKDYIDLAKARGIRFYPMFEIYERGIDAVTARGGGEGLGRHRRAISLLQLQRHGRLRGAGVTATEPGGLESREMVRVADIIGEQKTVSVIDVTELAPVYDVSGTTSRLAVCTVLRLMAAMARARGELVDQNLRRSDLTAAE